MKKYILIIMVLIISGATISANSDNMMSITVKKAQIRTSPSFLGKIVYILEYADRVEVFDERAGWFFIGIASSNDRGWVHSSALSKKKIVLKAGSENVGSNASNNEVALAGKGFNKQVEAQYRSQNDMDYTWIDKMEEYTFNPEEVIKFLTDEGIYPMEVN